MILVKSILQFSNELIGNLVPGTIGLEEERKIAYNLVTCAPVITLV